MLIQCAYFSADSVTPTKNLFLHCLPVLPIRRVYWCSGLVLSRSRVPLPGPLWKLWCRRVSRRRGRRGKRECLIVQLKRRANVETLALRRLYHDDSFAVWENHRVCDVSLMVFVDLYASFRIQYLVQPLLRTWLLRRFLLTGEQQAWPSSADYDNEADSDPVHAVIILLTCN